MGIKDEGISKISPHVMKKALTLRVVKAEDFEWWVSGGTEPHLVWANTSYEFACDCVGFMMRKSCSHVLAVKLELGIGPKEEGKELELWEIDPIYLGC